MATQLITQTRTTQRAQSIPNFVIATIKTLPTIRNGPQQEISPPPKSRRGFPISRLPAELRLKVYTEYFVSLPARPVTQSVLEELNTNQTTKGSKQNPSFDTPTEPIAPLYLNNPLALSSPFFALDVPPCFYYRYTEFNFSCAFVLKELTALSPLHRQIRHVRVEYGCLQRPGPDWVFLLSECFEKLERVVLTVEHLQEAGERFLNWWECVRGAMREAVGGTRENEVLVRVEDECGEIVAENLIGGHDKKKRICRA